MGVIGHQLVAVIIALLINVWREEWHTQKID